MKWNDYGESSLTLLAVHTGMDKKDPAVPLDPSDFRRCIHLFECLNLTRIESLVLIINTAEKYPIWIPFKENWDELKTCYEMEKDKDSSPMLFKKLQEASQ